MKFSHEYVVPTKQWHPQSEVYSGGDSLMTALAQGWEMPDQIMRECHSFSGRTVTVYHIQLQRRNQKATMHIVSNPFVERYLQNSKCHILSTTSQQEKQVQRMKYEAVAN